MELNRIKLNFHGKVAVLTFNHPEVMNAIDSDMLDGLIDAVNEIQSSRSSVRCLLITGEGRGFCAGANLADQGKDSRAVEECLGSHLRSTYHPLLLSLRDMDIPIVTAVNGAAAGVGMSFAMIGDIVCASKTAFFLQAFARVGLVPDGGVSFMLPRLIGWGRAMELAMLAERLPADKAYEWGLVNRIYDDNHQLMKGAMGIATRLSNGASSLALIRQLYWSTWHNSYEQQIDMEARFQMQASRTRDHSEGMKAFLEKRNPNFLGR